MKLSFREFLELDKDTQKRLGTLTEEMSVSVKKKKMDELQK